MSAAAASAEDARAACPPAPEPMVSPARLASEIRRTEDDLARLDRELRQMGCGGSIIVIRGSEGNVCAGLDAERAALESRLMEQRAAERRWMAGAQARNLAPACAGEGSEAPQHASYSQFRRPFGRGAIIELRPAETPDDGSPSASPVALAEPEPEPVGPQPLPGPPEEKPAGDLIDLEERLAERDVRVVGPKFLPDRSEAIDLRSPVPTFFP